MKPQKSLGRRGAVAAVIAVLAVVLIGVAGMALDMTRAYMVSGRLKTAVDATALFAAREINNADRDTRATELFWVNYRRNLAATTSYISSTAQNPVITALDASRIQVTGTATLDTTLFNVISRRTMTVNVASIAQRQGSGLEVALVVDTTSSMASASNIPGLTKLQAAQQAVGSLLEILYGGADTQRNLWVSVVPHSRQINIGTQHSALLNTSGIANWDVNAWGGCVQSRYTASHDIDDTGPTTAETQLRPYYWPTTYRQVGTRPATGSSSSYCQAYALQSGDTVRYCYGDNDWLPNPTSSQRTLLNSNPLQTSLRNAGLTEAQAKEKGLDVKTGKLTLGGVGAGTVYDDRDGMVKLVVDKEYGEIVGAHIVGNSACDMIAELVAVMALEGGIQELQRIMHPHPTISEAVLDAARAVDKWATHA